MRVYGTVVLLFALVGVCAPAQNNPSQDGPAEPINTTACELATSPERYDRRLIRIHSYISRGFEDSTLHDPTCPFEALFNVRRDAARPAMIWAEFADHEARYWKLKNYAPLLADDEFRILEKLIRERRGAHQMVAATMVGTFYAGKKVKINGKESALRGYGHFGCCAMFLISRVESADTNYVDELNYSDADWNVGLPEGCFSEQMLGLPTNETVRRWQQAANEGGDSWRHDPLQAADDHLRKIKSGWYGGKSGGTVELLVPGKADLVAPLDQRATETLLEEYATPFLKRYVWIEPDHVTRFVIVMTRPYWLEKLAGSAEKVIWVPAGSSMLCCGEVRKKRTKKH